jgi:hypothetical protein
MGVVDHCEEVSPQQQWSLWGVVDRCLDDRTGLHESGPGGAEPCLRAGYLLLGCRPVSPGSTRGLGDSPGREFDEAVEGRSGGAEDGTAQRGTAGEAEAEAVDGAVELDRILQPDGER